MEGTRGKGSRLVCHGLPACGVHACIKGPFIYLISAHIYSSNLTEPLIHHETYRPDTFSIQCMSKLGRGYRKASTDGTFKLDKVYIWGRRDG